MSPASDKTGKLSVLDLLLISGLFIIVFVLSLRRLADYDLWVHMKVGEYLFKTGSILTTYYFNCSWPEFPYLTHEWLFQAIAFRLYSVGGEPLLVSLQIVLVVASFFILYVTTRLYSANIPLIIGVIGLGVFASSHRFILRPQHFSYLFLTINLLVLHQYLRGRTGYLYFLPPIMLLWVNIHAESLWGIIVPFLFFVAEGISVFLKKGSTRNLKKLTVVYLFVVLASLVNPFTYKTVIRPLLIMYEQFAGVEELLTPLASRYYFFWLYFGVFILSSLIFSRNPKKVPIHFIVISIFFAAVAWTANRGIPHFVFASAPVIVAALDNIEIRAWSGRIRKFAGLALLLLMLIFIFLVVSDRRYFRKFDSVPYPEGAVRFIKDMRIRGSMFNLHGWGGYLIWELFPDVRTYIDNRFFHRKFFEEYEEILFGGGNWQELLARYNISIVLLDYSPSQAMNLRDYLFSSPDWRLVYWDDESLLYLRNEPSFSGIIHRSAMRIVNPDTDRFQFQKIERSLVRAALVEVKGDMENAKTSWRAHFIQGSLAYAEGDAAGAIDAFEKALKLAPDPVPAIFFNLGQAYVSLGSLQDAERSFKEAIRLTGDKQAYLSLWRIYILQGRHQEADELFRKHLSGA